MIGRESLLGRLHSVRRVHDHQYQAACPAHEDREPSLSVTFANGRILLHCFAGCPVEAIVEALGLRMRDLFDKAGGAPGAASEPVPIRTGPPRPALPPKGPAPAAEPESAPPWEKAPVPSRGRPGRRGASRLTVAALAEHKQLPLELLQAWGLTERDGAVVVPYRGAGGETLAERLRTRLVAGEGSFWVKGATPTVYGLDRLDGDDTCFLVEGESDTWTLAHHGLPVLGVPGAGLTATLPDALLHRLRTLYVVQEPDRGGWTFVGGITRRLRETAWQGRAFVIRMERLGAKDPSALHIQDPGHFRSAFRKAMDDAEQLVYREEEEGEGDENTVGDYQEARDGLYLLKSQRDGVEKVKLANFTARIVADVHHDDGVESARCFEIQSHLKGRTATFALPARQFDGLGWIPDKIGAEAVIFPGRSLRDHVRVGIQLLSRDIRQRVVFTHTGWRQLDGRWAYLHGDGAITPDGDLAGVEVELPRGLGAFALPAVPHRLALAEAVADSLKMLEVAPDRVTLPVFAAVWRSVLGGADFGLHLAGPSGSGKSELAALAQQHFGAGLDARHLPGGWSSTGNALEVLAFSLKDALCVVDDFAPNGGVRDVVRYHREAERLFRAQGNLAGRMRLGRDGQLLSERPPRGLVLSTGEDVPHGFSIRARLLILEMEPGAMDWDRLTECQRLAAGGRFASALAGFLQWLAAAHPEIRRNTRDEAVGYRNQLARGCSHRRTPANLAELLVGFRLFLTFALEKRALPLEEAEERWRRAWSVMGEISRTQSAQQLAADPVQRFLELLLAAVASGQAHVAARDGGVPDTPSAWGWREVKPGLETSPYKSWEPLGRRVGWVDGEGIYLIAEAAYQAAVGIAGSGQETIHVTPTTLWRRLQERGLLVACETDRRTLKMRRVIEGRLRTVLMLGRSTFEVFADKADNEQTNSCEINVMPLSAWVFQADNVPTMAGAKPTIA